MLSIVKAPNTILHVVCKPADLTLTKTHFLANDMVNTLRAIGGRGLAAPQVNRAIRMFVMAYGNDYIVCVNPEITRRGREKVTANEGCLSMPGHKQPIVRSKICNLEYTDLVGNLIKLKLRDTDARCAQHEMDHLNGILITSQRD